MADIIIKNRKFTNADDLHQKWSKDSEYRKEYEALEEEFQIVEQFIKARLQLNLTQTELAKRSGLHQEAIARLESFDSNPTRKTLTKVAKALNKKVALIDK